MAGSMMKRAQTKLWKHGYAKHIKHRVGLRRIVTGRVSGQILKFPEKRVTE